MVAQWPKWTYFLCRCGRPTLALSPRGLGSMTRAEKSFSVSIITPSVLARQRALWGLVLEDVHVPYPQIAYKVKQFHQCTMRN